MLTYSRVLVTGSAGRIGQAVVTELLARGHQVVGYDVRPTPGLPPSQSIIGSVTDSDQLQAAARGSNVIVHLAATPDDSSFPRQAPPHDSDNFLSDLVPNNIVGPYQIMEAARRLTIPRVILASTGQVIDGHLQAGHVPVTPELLPSPRYLYACTKVFLESLGQVYARHHRISVLAVRLGWCPRDAGQIEEIRRSELAQDVYLSPGDAGRFFAAAVEAAKLPSFAIVYATSRPLYVCRYDLSAAHRLLHWEPMDHWPQGLESFQSIGSIHDRE